MMIWAIAAVIVAPFAGFLVGRFIAMLALSIIYSPSHEALALCRKLPLDIAFGRFPVLRALSRSGHRQASGERLT